MWMLIDGGIVVLIVLFGRDCDCGRGCFAVFVAARSSSEAAAQLDAHTTQLAFLKNSLKTAEADGAKRRDELKVCALCACFVLRALCTCAFAFALRVRVVGVRVLGALCACAFALRVCVVGVCVCVCLVCVLCHVCTHFE